jgi:cytochrome c-type biogenesis protein CcmH/NrfF
VGATFGELILLFCRIKNPNARLPATPNLLLAVGGLVVVKFGF